MGTILKDCFEYLCYNLNIDTFRPSNSTEMFIEICKNK